MCVSWIYTLYIRLCRSRSSPVIGCDRTWMDHATEHLNLNTNETSTSPHGAPSSSHLVRAFNKLVVSVCKYRAKYKRTCREQLTDAQTDVLMVSVLWQRSLSLHPDLILQLHGIVLEAWKLKWWGGGLPISTNWAMLGYNTHHVIVLSILMYPLVVAHSHSTIKCLI